MCGSFFSWTLKSQGLSLSFKILAEGKDTKAEQEAAGIDSTDNCERKVNAHTELNNEISIVNIMHRIQPI